MDGVSLLNAVAARRRYPPQADEHGFNESALWFAKDSLGDCEGEVLRASST